MKRLALIAVFLLAACAPVLTATIERQGNVIITVTTTAPMELVGVTITAASLEQLDERCSVISAGLASCDLGTLDGTATLVIEGERVACVASGYESANPTSYRVARCEVRS